MSFSFILTKPLSTYYWLQSPLFNRCLSNWFVKMSHSFFMWDSFYVIICIGWVVIGWSSNPYSSNVLFKLCKHFVVKICCIFSIFIVKVPLYAPLLCIGEGWTSYQIFRNGGEGWGWMGGCFSRVAAILT